MRASILKQNAKLVITVQTDWPDLSEQASVSLSWHADASLLRTRNANLSLLWFPRRFRRS